MTDHSGQIPAVVLAAYPNLRGHPIIGQTFTPGEGWVTVPTWTIYDRRRGTFVGVPRYKKRVTVAWCRKLHNRGVRAVALIINGRLADFTTKEILRTQVDLPE